MKHITAISTFLLIGPTIQANQPPEIQISVSPAVIGSVPAVVDYAVTASDPDGTVDHIYWSFGDGGHRLNPSGQYTYVSPGTYQVTVTVSDNQDATATAATTVTISDPAHPTLTIDAPASNPTTVTTDQITLSGQSTLAETVRWSTDRGEAGVATGTDAFTADIPLHAGRNRVLINAVAVGGATTLARREIHYHPPGPLGITNVTPQDTPAQRWEPFTIQFDIVNSRATELDWPYEPVTPPGLTPGLGITVDGEFSDDGFATSLVQPGFLYQPFHYESRNNRDWLTPDGRPRWMIRFAPPRVGSWEYRIKATDAGGTATSGTFSFEVAEPTEPGNHGFVRVNPDDSRYWRFDDGTHFLGIGHNEGYTDFKTFVRDYNSRFAMIGSDSADFFRIWTLSSCIAGSGHPPLLSATLGYYGYLPHEGLTPRQAFADGDVSVQLDAAGNPCMFYGWLGGDTALEPGHVYRVRVRVKLLGVTGPNRAGHAFGFTVKRINWPDPPDFFPDKAAIIAHRTGSLDWTVLEGDFTVSANYLGNFGVILENATGGQAFVDEISIREVLSGGEIGPELNRRPRLNYHLYFDDLGSWQFDYLLERCRRLGIYYRIVLSEKNDYVLGRLGPAGFMESSLSPGNFNALPGTKGYALQTYWWRYATARWGAYRSLHSWELANEQDPWDPRGYRHTQNLAAWMHAHDPNRRDAVTSFWHSFPSSQFWGHALYPDVAFADVHQYLYDGTPEQYDTAYAHWTLGRDLASRGLNKPIIRGETGILGPEAHGGGEHRDLKLDTQGVWLHNLTWATLDANGMYESYWYTQNIRGANVGHGDLYGVYRAFRRFMADIPLGNGSYADAVAAGDHDSVRVVGQVDSTAGRGHLWIQHAGHTWRRVVDAVTIEPIDASVTVASLLPYGRYAMTWWDTYAGTPIGQSSVVATREGVLTVQINDLISDVAVKFQLDRVHVAADLDRDDDVDQTDFGYLQSCYTGPGVTQTDPTCQNARLDADVDVDRDDFLVLERCLSGANQIPDVDCTDNRAP